MRNLTAIELKDIHGGGYWDTLNMLFGSTFEQSQVASKIRKIYTQNQYYHQDQLHQHNYNHSNTHHRHSSENNEFEHHFECHKENKVWSG